MPSLAYAHFCDFAYFDRFKKPCVISLWEHLIFKRMPGMIDKGALVVRIEDLPRNATIDLAVEAVTETGATLQSIRTSCPIPESGTLVAIMTLNQLKVHEYGRYRFDIRVNNESVGATFLNVEPALDGSEHRSVVDLSGETE